MGWESQRAEGREELRMSNGREQALCLLVGVGIGFAVGILLAPQSGEETREWLSHRAEERFKRLRRQGRRLLFEGQELLERGEESVNRALRSGKQALESVAAQLD
jgi:gas vesicle protein